MTCTGTTIYGELEMEKSRRVQVDRDGTTATSENTNKLLPNKLGAEFQPR
jgi:hypothetical protein